MLALSRAAGVHFAAAEQQIGAQAVGGQSAGDIGQRLGVDDAGPQLGQVALGAIGVPVKSSAVMVSPSTASPRNSSRSLVGRPPFS